ncbi:MAG: glycosyltransferase [Gemmatimonadetes bacterium]|nr:glycosyltransferase [Gemmatimonadota bacterium]MBL0179952.1 glycosyltransferase [Gemmatimonadota bacterium]
MKIAHVVFDLSVGGMERLIVDLAKRQQARGEAVAVYCIASEAGALAVELMAAGIPVTALGKRPGADLALVWRLRGLFRAGQFDVIHTHNNVASLYGGMAGRLAGIGMVLNTRHGMADMPYDHRREQIYRASVVFLHRVAFVCHRALDFSVRKGLVPRRKAIVVYNGVDMAPYRVLDAEGYADVRRELALPPTVRLVGTVCRLTAAKDLPSMVRLAQQARAHRNDVVFVIVGAGEEETAIRALVRELALEDVVRLPGRRTDVARWLSAFDVFVMTSLSEGMSLALIEAAAEARPIVTTDVGGSADVVLDGVSGFVVPVGAPECFLERVEYLLDHPVEAAAMGAAGRERALTAFDIEATCAAYEALYQRR